MNIKMDLQENAEQFNQSRHINDARKIFDIQRAAYLENPYPSIQERLVNLRKLEQLLIDHQDSIVDAVSKDFGHRAAQETKLLELFLSIDGLRHSRKKLKKWMKPQKRSVSPWFAGAKNTLLPQPKGVIGVIAPWNYPLFLVIGPLANAMAAGNRCMVKMASNSQNLCRLLQRLVSERFDEKTLAVLPGVGADEFTPLPFDHLVFTGSPASGKTVMKTAAENLTPVTLELGGKSPVVVCDDFSLSVAAERIVSAKFANSGQTCVAPDYLLLPEGKVMEFAGEAKRVISKHFPKLESKDYTSIIDETAYNRLLNTLENARANGARLFNLMGDQQADRQSRKIPAHIIADVNDDMLILKEEILGPLVPILTYKNLDDALRYINRKERPLALYLFTNNKKIQQQVIKTTISGGVCLNDCILHAAQHDMPFGGIGNSGMGHYHGVEGFNEFSKLKPIFKQSKFSTLQLLRPPYGHRFDRIYNLMIKLKL